MVLDLRQPRRPDPRKPARQRCRGSTAASSRARSWLCNRGSRPVAFLARRCSRTRRAVLADLQAGLYPQRTITRRRLPHIGEDRASGSRPISTHPRCPARRVTATPRSISTCPALYYSFDLNPAVLGISLDTGGYNSGSIGEGQFDVARAHACSRPIHAGSTPDGTEVRGGTTDRLVIVFSHFNPRSMNSPMTDPANPTERRVLGDEIVALFHRYPNMVAWVNGHHHVNEVTPMPDPSGRTGGFWDINTASHVDYPEHARLIEVVDNADGTLSIFSTMIEHAAGPTTNPDDTSVLGLASISRELSANDPQTDLASRLGQADDLNVELVLTAPFDLSSLGRPLRPPARRPRAPASLTSTMGPDRRSARRWRPPSPAEPGRTAQTGCTNIFWKSGRTAGRGG